MKKKVLIVNQHYHTGGIKTSLENLLHVLNDQYDVELVLLYGKTSEFKHDFSNIKCYSPFLISSVGSSLVEIKQMGYYPLRLLLKMYWKLLSKFVGFEKSIKLAIKMSKRQIGYDSVIAYAHDNWYSDGGFMGGCNYFAQMKVVANKKYAWLHGEPKAIGLTANRVITTYSNFDKVITVSNACKEQFEILSQGKIPCKVIRNMYNFDKINKKIEDVTYQRIDNMFYIVTVGRINKVAKRMDKVNEIAKLLKEAGYCFDWTVVGDGSELDKCVRICREYGLQDMVHYIGNQNNPYPYMKQGDVLVLVSDSEASPMVINEALIVGTPIVTTNFQAACELIKDGKNGLICDKDVLSIYEKIVCCIEHPEMVKEFRKYISEHPVNNDKSIRALEELFG